MKSNPLLLVGCTVAGFALGWMVRPAFQERPSPEIAAAQHPSARPAASTVPLSPVASPSLPATTVPIRQDTEARLENLRWLKRAGVPLQVFPFPGDSVNEALVRILSLDANERASLNAALAEAKSAVDAARSIGTKTAVSEDGKRLVIDFPAVETGRSAQIHDRFLDRVVATVGDDRMRLFREISQEGFTQTLDQFGLNPIRYEFTLAPEFNSESGQSYYSYQKSFVDPTGESRGSRTGVLTIEEIKKNDPLLGGFLPASFPKGSKP